MKHLLLTLSLFLCFNVEAQRKTVHLDSAFGLGYMQSKMQVSNLYSDTVKAKQEYPKFWEYRASIGYRWGSFMALSAFDAAAGEAARMGHGGNVNATLNSHNGVAIPSGEYWQTIIFEVRGNEVFGKGTGYVGTDGKNSDNTELVIWHEKWQGDPNERHCIQTPTWNLGKSNTYYSEGGRIENLSFNGRQSEFLNDKFNSTGVRLWYPGECYTIDRLYPSGFRTAGIEIFGATPLNAGNVSVFDNVVAGVIFYSSGQTVNWGTLSGDDNGALFKCAHGYDDTGGGLIHFGALKMETAVASQDRTWRDQVVGYIEGQFGVVADVVSSYAGARYQNVAFIVDSRSPKYPPQGSCLSVGAFRAHNFKNVVMQLGGGTNGLDPCYYACKGDLSARGFDWSTDDDGKGTLIWKATRVNGGVAPKVAHACTTRVATTGTAYPTGCTPYREIADGPPRKSTITYLDQITGGTTPPPTPCTYTYSAWGACTNGTETRTVVSSTPAGCTGTPVLSQPCTVAPGTWTCTSWGAWSTCSNSTQTRVRTCTCTGGTCVDPKPAESETQACTVTPPPTGSAIDPNDVLVVWNSSDARTQAWATAYASAWGIPSGNVISVAAGTSHDATTTVATAIRTLTESKGKQYTVLAWEYPSRVGSQSITSLVTFGPRNVSSLTVSTLYNYTGTKPRTDKGVAPSALLVSDKYIRKDADGTRPQGQAILLLANDATGAPRGIARKGQTATGVTVWDNTVPIKRPGKPDFTMGKGLNSCNFISTLCFLDVRTPSTVPILAAYQSMYELGDAGAVVWAKGFYADHVTSVGGYLPGGAAPNYLNSQGQTALTYHLAKGASMSVGSVSEPWQGGDGSLAKQFVNVSIFHPLFMSGKPVGVAAWASVQCPDRMLFCGDLLCAPMK